MDRTTSGTWEVVDGKLVDIDPQIIDRGYWVATTNDVATSDDDVDRLAIAHIDNGAGFVGIWWGGDITFVDNVQLVGDLIDAITLGRLHAQESIWDIYHNHEINL